MVEGMVRFGIECYMTAAIGRICCSRTNFILWCIVKMTETATWSHFSALLSMTETNQCKRLFTNSCMVVITSSGTVEMLETQSVAIIIITLSSIAVGAFDLSTSLMRNRYGLNVPWSDITCVR